MHSGNRGLITPENLANLRESGISYILDVRMDSVNEVKRDLLSRISPYREVYPESNARTKPVPLKVKEVIQNRKR